MQVRRTIAAALTAASLVLAAGCGSDDGGSADSGGSGSGDKGAVSISGQNFPEATLVASMYEQLLDSLGYDASVKLVGTRDVYMAAGQFPDGIQVVPEYVGGLVDFLNATANGADAPSLTTNDPAETIAAVQPLLDDKGITLLDPSSATDQNAFFVTQQYAEDNGLSALSDLEGTSVVLAAAEDCPGRSDCEGGLTKVYGIDVTKVLPLGFASDQTYRAVLDGEAQLGLTSTTDGTLADQGLVLLEDDKGIQTAQNLVPAVSTSWIADHQDAADALNQLMAALTTEKLTELNGRISVDREQPDAVAKDFLTSEGLLQ
ncbi:MAG TPA: ABC transporter substrate-binding protein [Nocardioides sp.]|uniref:ABC transporter substrate-binding protein n=1 Tax=Nocardioides sp. TaxID=35761 RepID=UPI002B86357C|nr:ABC transporter substrate-binding protein [Nocardioides sp.]HQR26525.1 ABC transporter substrate-binding protein [Nocardioides sp.]